MARSKKLPKVLTAAEQDALLKQLNPRYQSPHRNRVMLRLMLATGLRAGEVVALRPEHIDMDTCRLVVREGKGARDRVLWFPDDVRDELEEWLDRRPDSEYLFPTRDGKQLATRYLRELVSRLAERAEIAEHEKVSPHTLRHTFATDLYRETRDLRLVQAALGHSSVQTTEIYTHLVNGEVEDALRRFRVRETPLEEPEDDVEALRRQVEALQDAMEKLTRKQEASP